MFGKNLARFTLSKASETRCVERPSFSVDRSFSESYFDAPSPMLGVKRCCYLLLAIFLFTSAAEPTAPATQKAHRIVGLLQYIESDYPNAIASKSETELSEQLSFIHDAKQLLAQLDPANEKWSRSIVDIEKKVLARVPANEVSPSCAALAKEIIATLQLQQWPQNIPSLTSGKNSFFTACAQCHGDSGHGDGPAGKLLDPAPANFHNTERMSLMTPYKAFNTATQGLVSTGMPSFATLPEDERWNVAFFLFTLRQPECTQKPSHVSLEELATSSDAQLTNKYGAAAVPCLRRLIFRDDDVMASLQKGMREVEQLTESGDLGQAKGLLTDLYLKVIEPHEVSFRARDAAKAVELETHFMTARHALETGQPKNAKPSFKEIVRLVEKLSKPQEAQFFSVLLGALLILLREGFECVVIVGALLAVLKKSKAGELLRAVNLGWVLALATGILAFILGHRLIGAAHREWVETLIAFLAVGMLLYAAVWLNARSHVSAFMTDLRKNMQGAIQGNNAIGLFAISFTAVFRETFETAIFLQSLALDSLHATILGGLLGVGLLLAVVFGIRRIGISLPMQKLFKLSTWVLLGMSVALIGKGVHGLQELGVAPIRPVLFIRIDTLGIFDDAYSLVAQLLMAVAVVLLYKKTHVAKSRETAEAQQIQV